MNDIVNDQHSFTPELELLNSIRVSLNQSSDFIVIPDALPFKFNPKISQVYITLFQEGMSPLRWGSKQETLKKTIQRIIFKLKTNSKFTNFQVHDSSTCRIMFEIVMKEYPCNIRNLTTMRMNSPNRFEPGVNGLKWKYQNVTRYFMPTDGYTKSIMSVRQLLNYLSKRCGIAKKTNKISERADLMRREAIEYTFIESKAYISYKNEVSELDRGYPTDELGFSKDIVYDRTIKSIDWLISNMNEDGSFLYYYDPYKNTVIDDVHPKMVNPLYNNILRHSGGTITLLRGYELSSNKTYLEKAKDSIDFLISTFKTHTYKKEFACYPFFNKKSKLGGAGIGLVSIMHYYLHTKDERYRKELDGLVRHILSRVDKDGEMIGYYIHPKFNEGKALVNPSDEVKKELFSFYYPGEALLGLALYYRYIKNIDNKLKEDIRLKSEMALDFLVDVRPVKYNYMFESLPADAWLMQAIEEWVKVEGFKKQSYIDFVFDDTKQMFDHMYTNENTNEMNKDYIGGFYYNYGDHVYHDASRCEGVVSAYYLAQYLKDDVKAKWIMDNMLLSAKGLMKTFHNEKSVYAHIDQKKALNSFRFKLTRQWVRVDSVQHAACFFARLLPIIKNQESKNENSLINNKYQIINLLDEAGYSKVYKVKNINNMKTYALKLINEPRYINLIMNENKILNIMNKRSNIKFHEFGQHNNSVYFVFDYAENGNLKKYVEKHGSFNDQMIYDFISEMIETLAYSKKNNILHLDIKPANILLHNGKFTLSDWGNSVNDNYSNSIHLKANPVYLAPEFYYGKRCFESEIYALGCTIYFLLTAKHPFGLRYRYPLVKKIYSHIYLEPDLSKIKSNKMKYLLSRMLDKNPNSRISLDNIKRVMLKNDNKYSEYEFKMGDNIEVDFKDEVKLYKQMSNDNIPFAQNELGRIYIRKGMYKKAYDEFLKAAKNGYTNAIMNTAAMHYVKKFDMIDEKKAFDMMEIASQEEYDKAQYYMGLFYEKGFGCKRDIDKAIIYFKRSAKNAYKKAYAKLNTYNIKLTLDDQINDRS